MSQRTKKFTKDSYNVTYSVNSENENKRLDQFLQIHFLTFSRQQIKKVIEEGRIRIEGRDHKLKPSTKVKEHEVVYITTEKEDLKSEIWNGEEVPQVETVEVVYEDSDVVVINKPPFMSTHPTGKHLFYCATVYLEAQLGAPVYSVHRLDRETSGVIILSKKAKSSARLVNEFENKRVQKVYFFIAHEKRENQFPFSAHERLGQKIGFIPELYMHCYEENSTEGKASHTDFYFLERSKGYILGLAAPRTGRQHQIRSHAAHYGMPLLGDKLYNGDPSVFTRFKDKVEQPADRDLMQIPRHALHALAIKIPEIYQKSFRTQLPLDLKEWIQNNLDISLSDLDKKIVDSIEEILG